MPSADIDVNVIREVWHVKIVRATKNYYVAACFVLLCGLISGWFIKPHWLWEREFIAHPERPPDIEMLASGLQLDAHCSMSDLAEERKWQESGLLPRLLASGHIKVTGPGVYAPAGQLWLDDSGAKGDAVTTFGWFESKEYLERFYTTTVRFADISRKFKQRPNKSGENQIVIKRLLTLGGPVAQQILHISKTEQGTRIGCREFRVAMK